MFGGVRSHLEGVDCSGTDVTGNAHGEKRTRCSMLALSNTNEALRRSDQPTTTMVGPAKEKKSLFFSH